MIEKIKQNPKKVLGVVAGVFFIAAILFMLLPGITYSGSQEGVNVTISASLFAFITGGKVFMNGEVMWKEIRVNGMTVFPFVLLILAIVLLAILICGLFTEKFKRKTNIILSIIIIVLVVASSIIIFASKESMIRYALAGTYFDLNGSQVSAMIEGFKSVGKFSLGAGAIVTPIMMLLGAVSLGGVICLSAKK